LGGNSDLGAPIYSTAHGLVVFARDVHLGWGNVVVIRQIYFEQGIDHFDCVEDSRIVGRPQAESHERERVRAD